MSLATPTFCKPEYPKRQGYPGKQQIPSCFLLPRDSFPHTAPEGTADDDQPR